MSETDFEVVECQIEYYLEIDRYDAQHNCSDGKTTYGPFYSRELAIDYMNESITLELHDHYYVRKLYKEIVK